MKKIVAASMICIAALAGCAKNEKAADHASTVTNAPVAADQASPGVPQAVDTTASAAATSTMPAVPASSATAVQKPGTLLTGKVVETFNGAGYTYLRLSTPKGDEWAAVRETPVKKGQVVTVLVDMTAEKFESTSLKRTFDRITFGTVAAPGSGKAAAAGQMPPGHPQGGNMGAAMAGMMGTPSDHMKPKVDVANVKVDKAEGADAKTVAEVWGGKAALADKEVVVRGKVVKFLGGIMGTNFMHVRDGSGSDGAGDNDLTITTNDVAKVGDVVTVRGVVHVDKDFGAGYRYPVIVENGKVSK